MQTQWNIAPDGKLIGLNLPALKTAMSFYDIDDESLMYERISICEQEQLLIQRENQTEPL